MTVQCSKNTVLLKNTIACSSVYMTKSPLSICEHNKCDKIPVHTTFYVFRSGCCLGKAFAKKGVFALMWSTRTIFCLSCLNLLLVSFYNSCLFSLLSISAWWVVDHNFLLHISHWSHSPSTQVTFRVNANLQTLEDTLTCTCFMPDSCLLEIQQFSFMSYVKFWSWVTINWLMTNTILWFPQVKIFQSDKVSALRFISEQLIYQINLVFIWQAVINGSLVVQLFLFYWTYRLCSSSLLKRQMFHIPSVLH